MGSDNNSAMSEGMTDDEAYGAGALIGAFMGQILAILVDKKVITKEEADIVITNAVEEANSKVEEEKG
jgi:glycerol uptake facilitator-like aquaporin